MFLLLICVVMVVVNLRLCNCWLVICLISLFIWWIFIGVLVIVLRFIGLWFRWLVCVMVSVGWFMC